jgi:prevent-host-death family protein
MPSIYISTADAKQSFSQVINEVFYGEKKFVITAHGKPKAIISPVDTMQSHITSLSQPSITALHALKALHSRFTPTQLSSEDLEIPRSERDSDICDLC